MPHITVVMFVLWVTCLGDAVGAGATPSPNSFNVRQWTSEHGLPQNNINALCQTPDGYLWAGTPNGLARFDGLRFALFNQANTPAFAQCGSEAITSLAVDGRGYLWIGTLRGLIVRDTAGGFSALTVTNGLIDKVVLSLLTLPDGRVLVGTQGGLNLLRNGVFEPVPGGQAFNAKAIMSLNQDNTMRVWLGTDFGLSSLDLRTGEARFWDAPKVEETQRGLQPVPFLCVDSAGRLWVRRANYAALQMLENEQLRTIVLAGVSLEGERKFFPVGPVFEDRQGRLWAEVQSELRVFRMRNGELIPEAPVPGVPNPNVIYEDTEGNLWVGTASDGLFRLRPGAVLAYTEDASPALADVRSIAASTTGSLWFGGSHGVVRMQNGILDTFRLPDIGGAVRSVLVTRDETVWVGARVHGDCLWRWENGTFTPAPFAMEFKNRMGEVRALYEDAEGALWIGTETGLYSWTRKNDEPPVADGALGRCDVRGVLKDKDVLWVATHDKGLYRKRNGTWRSWNTPEGLGHRQVHCLFTDSQGTLWIGTQMGLNRLRNDKLQLLTTTHGLFDNVVNQVLEDDQGHFWIGCNRGIYRVKRDELNAVADGLQNRVSFTLFGEQDGMPVAETNGELQPSACKTRDGLLWFPTPKGVVCIDPRTAGESRQTPRVLIQRVVVDGVDIYNDGPPVDGSIRTDQTLLSRTNSVSAGFSTDHGRAPGLQLEAGRGRVVEIYYTSTSLSAPDKVRFRCKLTPGHSDWREDASNRRVAFFTNLKPGEHVFQVVASNEHGVWNQVGATFAFTIAPHFYQTWMFYASLTAGLALLGWAIVRYRLGLQHQILKLEQEAAIERIRSRFAQDIHDEIGSTLSQIAIQTAVAKRALKRPEIASEQLDRIAQVAGQAVDTMGELLWAASPKHDELDDLVGYLRSYVLNLCESLPLRCSVSTPEVIPDLFVSGESRRNLLAVVKEGINNALKHSGARNLQVQIWLDKAKLWVLIADDGHGFASNGTKVVTSSRRRGRGLQNMQERMSEIGGSVTIVTKPGYGTKLGFCVPLQKWR